MTIHPTAAEGFTEPDVYELGRPGYPEAAVRHLEITSDTRTVDLGCGTGKLTRQLAGRCDLLIGIEPLPAMLDAFRHLLPGVGVMAGAAEALPLRDSSVDHVVCASAFHWFDHERAIPEIARVLTRNGRLAIIWNRRDSLVGWAAEFWEITEQHRGDTPGYRTGAWRKALEASALFGPIDEAFFDHVQRADHATLLARVGSISFIKTLPLEKKREVMERARDFLATHPATKDAASIDVPYKTAVYVTSPK